MKSTWIALTDSCQYARKLQKRREAKDDMIQLRMKVLEANAGDLGWPERMPQGRRAVWPQAPPRDWPNAFIVACESS